MQSYMCPKIPENDDRCIDFIPVAEEVAA